MIRTVVAALVASAGLSGLRGSGTAEGPVKIKISKKMLAAAAALVSTAAVAAEQKTACMDAPLAPQAMEPLPLGAIRPTGWLAFQLGRMTDGLVGRLYETSEFLTPSNGWLRADGRGWEEQPYWFRSFVKLAALTGDERCLKVSREWVEGILATQDADGWFGPANLKERRFANGGVVSDIWGHMVMSEALMSWWEATGDRRVVDLLVKFYRYVAALPEAHVLAEWQDAKDYSWPFIIQKHRGGDALPTLYRLHGLTGDAELLRLCRLLMRKTERPGPMWLDRHTVNFAERFAYWTLYSRLTGNAADRASADYWYGQHMSTWGQMPRGVFAADEQVRSGYTDPRQGTESCTFAEFVRSFNLLGDFLGDPRWADRVEDLVFNHAPCAYTADWKELHYVTAANQVSLDARTDHDYFNHAPQIAYSSVIYRCCRHNAALTFPLFAENLVKKGGDGALVFWTYAPHAGKTVLAGNAVSWRLDTRYPFRETAVLDVESGKPLTLRFRVPAWAKGFAVGAHRAAAGAKWLEVRLPSGKSRLDLAMEAACAYTFWPRSGGVTVDRGPLSYSLAIGEKYGRIRRPRLGRGGSLEWPETETATGFPQDFLTEVLPTTPWNYALDVSAPLEFRECAWTDDCFVASNAVCEIAATGRRLPEWTLQDNQPAPLQPSPAFTTGPAERLRFVPLGCQRCRLSVLPQATDDPETGVRWTKAPAVTTERNRETMK